MPRTFQLDVLPGSFCVCRLDPNSPLPDWATGEVVSLTRTIDELSVVCAETNVPQDVTCEAGWRCLRVLGPLDFSLVGVIASLTSTLAASGISVFVISTFNTDLLMVKEAGLDTAITALRSAGHEVF